MLKWRKEVFVIGAICLVVGMVVGYLIAYRQFVVWGVEKEQQKISSTIQQIKAEEEKLDALLRAIKTYDREVCRLIEDLRTRPSEED